MTDVVRLVPKPTLIDRSVVETLKDALADAEAGKLIAVSVVGVTAAHGMLNYTSMSDRRFELAGALFTAAHELVRD